MSALEQGDNYLFHGTAAYSLAAIIASDELVEGAYWNKPGEPHGPRLTESVKVASSFIGYNAYYSEGGILVLDREKLAADYELVAYQDKSYEGVSWGDEREIVPITPAIKPLSNYLVGIIFDPAYIDAVSEDEFMKMSFDEGGWPYSLDRNGIRRMKKHLERLRDHPLLNAVGSDDDIPRLGNIELNTFKMAI